MTEYLKTVMSFNAESIALKESVPTPTGDSSWCFEDDIISDMLCVCGAQSRAHKDCPLNSRNRYVGCTLFPKAFSSDSGKGDNSKLPKASKVDTGSAHLGKREKQRWSCLREMLNEVFPLKGSVLVHSNSSKGDTGVIHWLM